jgi:hypothetical protein
MNSSERVDEYYVLRVVGACGSVAASREVYVGRGRSLGPLSRARRFRTADDASAHAVGEEHLRQLELVVQFCTRRRRRSQSTPLGELIDRVSAIPQPYRRTAYKWLCGRDVQALLSRESPEVYERHRRVLLGHDIDISRRSTVVLLRPRRRKITLNTGTPPPGGGPLRYFVPRSERPSQSRDE